MKERRKKKQRVRTRDWEKEGEYSFTHDLKRHRRTNTAVSDVAPVREVPNDFQPNGIVVSHSKKWAVVNTGDEEQLCRIVESIFESGSTLLAPGDDVLVEEIEGEPWVIAVKPRRSRLSRLAIEHARIAEQVIAANVDTLVIVAATMKPAINPGLIDRYLISAQTGGVAPLLCINKMDLVSEEPPEAATYRALGIPVTLTSCETGDGIEALKQQLSGSLNVFAGASGAGKSSLLNALDPGLDLATREISHSTQRGKHTTTASHLYQLDGDIRVIDTPGIRQLGLWKVTHETLAFHFDEIAKHSAQCKFRDCSHTHEPGCAVLEAIEQGDIPEQRFASYLRIRDAIDEQTKRR